MVRFTSFSVLFLMMGIAMAGWAPLGAARADTSVLPGVYLQSEGSPLIPLLSTAQSIDIEIYTMEDPLVISLIRAALARKAQVRILKDPSPLGDHCNLFQPASTSSVEESSTCADQRKLMEEVRAAGGVFAPFDKHKLCPNGGGANGQSCYEHGKIAIFDKRIALISTGNFDPTNLCIASENPTRCNRDFAVVESDPLIVATLEKIFESDLAAQNLDIRGLIPAELSGTLTVSPYAHSLILDLIAKAQVSIDLETQYLKEPELNQALENAAKRGVQVHVTTASFCAFGTPNASESHEVTQVYSSFDAAGIASSLFNSSNEINGRPGYLHAKALVIDGKQAWVGSINGSTPSFAQNREFGIIFTESAWVQKVLNQIRADHDSPASETWQESLRCLKDKPSP